MDDKKLEALAKELVKDIKSEKDLSDLTGRLVKLTVETALNSGLQSRIYYLYDSHSEVYTVFDKEMWFSTDETFNGYP